MPRISTALDDPTPLTGPRIDVPSRIGWLLRTSRMAAGVSLREMSAGLREHGVRLSTTSLSRIESHGVRSSAALDGYSLVLGLPEGSLRAGVDIYCRAFHYAPAPLDVAAPADVAGFSAAYEAVTTEHPTGGAWLDFAHEHGEGRGFGLPTDLMEPLVGRLIGQLRRTFGPAWATRAEALSLLRTGPYAEMVEAMMCADVLAPGSQMVDHVLSVISIRPSRSLLHWCGELLEHESSTLGQSGTYALQSMLVVGGLPPSVWGELTPYIVRAWERGEPPRRLALARLCAALPPGQRDDVRRAVDFDAHLPPVRDDWSRGRRNSYYEFARTLGQAVCARMGMREEPLLERLLFEALFEVRGVRMATASTLLASCPMRSALVTELLESRASGPDETSLRAAMRVAAYCHDGQPQPLASVLVTSENPHEFTTALALLGRAGQPVPDAAVEHGIHGDEWTVRLTLYSLGLTDDPRLADLSRRASLPTSVRQGAEWWSGRGGRILV